MDALTMQLVQDAEDDGVTGEDILSGAREVKVHVPERWTPEYAGFRMVEAFKHLRRAFVGRIGPKGAQGYWPEILHDAEDLRGHAADYRKQVEAQLARDRSQPSATDLARMDEALAWPMRFLASDPILADAVTVWAFTAAWEIDQGQFLKARKARALEIAADLARAENAEIERKRREAVQEAKEWAMGQFRKRKVLQRSAVDREAATESIRAQARIRAERALKKLPEVKVNATLGMPGKVLAVSTLGRLRIDGLDLLAERLESARVPVR